MWNTKENGIYTIKLKSLVDGILFHKSIDMEQICHKSMKWKVNRNYGNCFEWNALLNIVPDITRINAKYRLYLKDIHSIRISEEMVQSSCIAVMERIEKEHGKAQDTYEILVTFMNEKAVFINITEMRAGNVEPVYKIRACNEECYIVEEKEVLYIESCHNQVLWHCTNGIISSNNSLGKLEEQVSDAFVRIQRGYLVNKNHVRHIRRCEAQMSNGDVLSIPCKKYVTVRERLLG